MKDASLAKWVADLILADGVTHAQIEALSPERRADLIAAYLDEIGRRIVRIQNVYLTREDARKTFLEFAAAICKSG